MFSSIWIILVVWLGICTLHAFLSSRNSTSQAYHAFLSRNGLSISLGHAKVYWSGCHAWVHRLAALPGLQIWFDIGSVVCCVLLVASLPLLVMLLVNALEQPAEEQVLKPVIPGVNIPWSKMIYVALAVFVCAVLHELGHAVAAVREQVRVDGYGVFVFLIYPGAYVDVHDEHMRVISARRQLRVYAAGVWHNFVIAIFGAGLTMATPHLMSPLFALNTGVSVLSVKTESALYGQLPVGTRITAIGGDCPVQSLANLQQCVNRIYTWNPGYCLPLDRVKKQQRIHLDSQSTPASGLGVRDCCGPSSSHICFSFESSQGHQGQVCLSARNVTANPTCRSARHCMSSFTDVHGPAVCAKPQLDPASRLLHIQHTLGRDVLFEGNPYELYFDVQVSGYAPRWPWVSYFNYLPPFLEACGLYLMSISSALCFLNMVPVYYLDGHWVLITLIEFLLPPYMPDQRSRTKLAHVCLTVGTLLLAIVAGVGIIRTVIG